MMFLMVFVAMIAMPSPGWRPVVLMVVAVPGWYSVVLYRHCQDRPGHVLMGHVGPRPFMRVGIEPGVVMQYIVAFAVKKVIVVDTGCVVYRRAGHDDELRWRGHYHRGRAGYYYRRRAEVDVNINAACLHPGAGEQADNKYQTNGCTDDPVCHCFLQTQDVPVTASSIYSIRHFVVISLAQEVYQGAMVADNTCMPVLLYLGDVSGYLDSIQGSIDAIHALSQLLR
jgi:hypothetical protein